jgi:hypothetical protein
MNPCNECEHPEGCEICVHNKSEADLIREEYERDFSDEIGEYY